MNDKIIEAIKKIALLIDQDDKHNTAYKLVNSILEPEEEQPTLETWVIEYFGDYQASGESTTTRLSIKEVRQLLAKQIDKTKLERSVIHATKMSNLEQQITVLKADLKIERDLVKSLIK